MASFLAAGIKPGAPERRDSQVAIMNLRLDTELRFGYIDPILK